MISFKQVRYFVATAEHGKITQASEDLAISQSAVTTAIKELEGILGVHLFIRSQQGMELTTAGRQFLSHANDILEKVNEAVNLKMIANDLEGSLTVAATYTVIGYFLPAHLEKLRRMFPKLTINLLELNRENIEEGLFTNRYDIAVLLTSNINNQGLITETLFSSPRRLWLSAKHKLLTQESVDLGMISKEPYIMLTVDEAAYTSHRYWSLTPYQPNVVLRTSSVEAVRSMVANNQGVAILSDLVYRPWSLEGKRLETLVPNDPIPAMEAGLAWKKNIEFTPAMEAFRSYFRQAYQIPNSR